MNGNSGAAFLNSALTVASSPADLASMLTDRYLKLPEGERDLFVLALIGHIAAAEALRALKP